MRSRRETGTSLLLFPRLSFLVVLVIVLVAPPAPAPVGGPQEEEKEEEERERGGERPRWAPVDEFRARRASCCSSRAFC